MSLVCCLAHYLQKCKNKYLEVYVWEYESGCLVHTTATHWIALLGIGNSGVPIAISWIVVIGAVVSVAKVT